MADEFNLTPMLIRVSATAKQALKDALLVADYDQADGILTCYGVEGTSPSATFRIIGRMQTETEDGWVTVATGTAITTAGSQRIGLVGLPKYIRWEISAFSGSGSPYVVFGFAGMLRQN